MQTIHHKRNELLEVGFYKDKECTEDFDFTNAKNLYIQPVNGELTPLFYLNTHLVNKDLRINNLMIPHIANDENILYDIDDILKMRVNKIYTLGNDAVSSLELVCIIVNAVSNLSKYIPKDNAVLFLSEEGADKYADDCEAWFLYQKDFPKRELNSEMDIRDWKKLTIFLPHGTQSELQKANEVAKELKEKYGVEEVNLFALHCFSRYIDASNVQYTADLGFINQWSINKIITTNSTGILPVQDNERLQVIDAKEIFEEYLKNSKII